MSDGLSLARHFLDVRRPERALEILADLPADQVGAESLALRADAAVMSGDFWNGMQFAKRGLGIKPDHVGLWVTLAWCQAEFGGWQKADISLRRALALEPDNVQTMTNSALLYSNGGHFQAASLALARAVELAPESLLVKSAQMDIAFARGDAAEAQNLAASVLSIDPEHERAIVVSGALAEMRGRYKTSRRLFRKAAVRDIGNLQLSAAARMSDAMAHPLVKPAMLAARIPGLVWGGAFVLPWLVIMNGEELSSTHPKVVAAAFIWLFGWVGLYCYAYLVLSWARHRAERF